MRGQSREDVEVRGSRIRVAVGHGRGRKYFAVRLQSHADAIIEASRLLKRLDRVEYDRKLGTIQRWWEKRND